MKSTKRPRPTSVKPVKSKKIYRRKKIDSTIYDAARKNGLQILIVEDDQDHREALTVLLEQEGYEVTSANDGLQALERLRWGLRPSAILLDMRMHVMNGWEFQRELGRDRDTSGIPVVIMSGGPLKPEDRTGCADWISKPISGPELLRKLELCTRRLSAQNS